MPIASGREKRRHCCDVLDVIEGFTYLDRELLAGSTVRVGSVWILTEKRYSVLFVATPRSGSVADARPG
jgi:hypothetical protein